MPRFFIESVIDKSDELVLSGRDAHHIIDVLRMKPGDTILVCDGARNELHCRIQSVQLGRVNLIIEDRYVNNTEPAYRVTLFQGLAKGNKMDQIIRASVEMGVHRIVPVSCHRSVPVFNGGDLDRKTARWNRIAAEAAKQCGRGICPAVDRISRFDQALKEANRADLAIIPWELEKACSIQTVLSGFSGLAEPSAKKNPDIQVWIGPEGGFTEQEVQKAKEVGLVSVTLGRRIMRTETAGPAVLAMILYEFDDF
jgi:16S rRNA (uracil1498-N3)-methyltransferase